MQGRIGVLERPLGVQIDDFPAVDWDALETNVDSPEVTELAERLGKIGTQAVEFESDQPGVREIADMDFEPTVRERAARLFGRATLSEALPAAPEQPAPTTSLLSALQRAKHGDPEARKLIETNVHADMIERSIKAGHIMEIKLEQDAAGRIVQHGQTAESIQLNSLRYVASSWQMRGRTQAETRNMYRMELANQAGLLEDNYFVVFSRAADDMSRRHAHKAGFFVDTMSVAIQATTAKGTGLTTESAFVAGKHTPDAERHDGQTLVKVGQALHADLFGTATQLLDRPQLVPKSLMPNGVIDLAKLYQLSSGDHTSKLVQDPMGFLADCRQREAELMPNVRAITNQLIAECDAMFVPTDATWRLHKLSEEHLLRRAVTDQKINPNVFGAAAAVKLRAARKSFANGDYEATFVLVDEALDVAESSSCATEANSVDDVCEFISAECPLCHKKNVRTISERIATGARVVSGSCGCMAMYAD